MVTLEEAGYCFKIENSGRIYYLLIREEGEFIKFFLRKEKTFYWFKCYAGSIYNDFTREINVGNSILEEENTESIAVSYTHLDVYKRQGYVRACGIISYDEYEYLTEKIDLGERVDSRRYET